MTRFAATLAFLVSVGALADEPGATGYPSTAIASPTGKVVYRDSAAEFSVAMCGVEGHGKNADLDAGLIDFNTPDPARSAGPMTDDPRDMGRTPYDYRSSIVLGVTLGYRF